MNNTTTNTIPCEIKKYYSLEDSNLLKVKLRVIRTGGNAHKTKFSLDAIKKASNTLKNIPILGYLKVDENGDVDYDNHNTYNEIIKKGNEYTVVRRYLERPIGVVPESTKIEYVEEDGITYMECEGYIWKSYANEGLGVIMNSDKKSISMEIKVNDGVYDEIDSHYDITDFSFLGITVLGDNVSPAIKGACMTKYSEYSMYKDEIRKICNEIFSMNEQGGSEMEEIQKPVDSVVEEPVVEQPVVDEPAEKPMEEAEVKPVEEPVVEEPVAEEVAEKPTEEPVVEDVVEEPVVNEFAMFSEILGEVSTKEEVLDAIKTKISEYGEIIHSKDVEINSYKEQVESMKDTVEKYNDMVKEQQIETLQNEMNEILNVYSIDEELYKGFKEKVLNLEMSIDEFKKEVGFLYAENVTKNVKKFSCDKKDAIVSVNTNEHSNPYGGLAKRLLKK